MKHKYLIAASLLLLPLVGCSGAGEAQSQAAESGGPAKKKLEILLQQQSSSQATAGGDLDVAQNNEAARQMRALSTKIPDLEGCYVPIQQNPDGQPATANGPTLQYRASSGSTYRVSVDGVDAGEAGFMPFAAMRYFASERMDGTDRTIGSIVTFDSPTMMKSYMRGGFDQDTRNPEYGEVQLHFVALHPDVDFARAAREGVQYDFLFGTYATPGILVFMTTDLSSKAVSAMAAAHGVSVRDGRVIAETDAALFAFFKELLSDEAESAAEFETYFYVRSDLPLPDGVDASCGHVATAAPHEGHIADQFTRMLAKAKKQNADAQNDLGAMYANGEDMKRMTRTGNSQSCSEWTFSRTTAL